MILSTKLANALPQPSEMVTLPHVLHALMIVIPAQLPPTVPLARVISSGIRLLINVIVLLLVLTLLVLPAKSALPTVTLVQMVTPAQNVLTI